MVGSCGVLPLSRASEEGTYGVADGGDQCLELVVLIYGSDFTLFLKLFLLVICLCPRCQ